MIITDEAISKIEQVFGFTLYDWQKKYLKGDDSARPAGRRQGKTFAYCVRLLLQEWSPYGFPIDLSKPNMIDKMVDEYHGPGYNRWFRAYLRDINVLLIEAGFTTNARIGKGI